MAEVKRPSIRGLTGITSISDRAGEQIARIAAKPDALRLLA